MKKYVINGKFLADRGLGKTIRFALGNQYLSNLLLFTLIVNIVIPKAGFKYGEVPITLGNMLFAVLAIINIIPILSKKFSINELIIGGV